MFGAPHEEGDATYGKFRIGRGQVFNYAITTWTSNNYQLKVDIYKPLREKSDEELGFTITRLAKSSMDAKYPVIFIQILQIRWVLLLK